MNTGRRLNRSNQGYLSAMWLVLTNEGLRVQTIFTVLTTTACLSRLFWRVTTATGILILCHPVSGLAQDLRPTLAAKSYSPMTKNERWSQYLSDNLVSKGAYFRAFGASLGDSTANKPAQWGGPAKHYSLNFSSQFARFAIGGTVQSTMAAALNYDTRYHHCDCQGGWRRAVHALSRTFVTYDSSGHRVVDLPGLSGIYAGSMLMTYWYPRGYGPLTNGVRNGNIAVAITTGVYLVREFSPELKNMFHRRS